MANINTEIKMQGNNDAWFTTNAATVYPANIQIFHTDGRYKFTDGTTALSALPFLGSASQSLAQTLAVGAIADRDIEIENYPDRRIKQVGTGNEIGVSFTDGTDLKLYHTDGVTETSVVVNNTGTVNVTAGSFKKDSVEVATVNDLLTKADKQNGLVSGGAITFQTVDGTGALNDMVVAAAEWYITPSNYITVSDTVFLNIALSAAGLQRWIGVYGDNTGTIIKVEGIESEYAAYPDTPANHALIRYALVTDSATSSGPDLSGYMLISSKANQADVKTATNDSKYTTSLSLANKVDTIPFYFGSNGGTFSPADSLVYYAFVPVTIPAITTTAKYGYLHVGGILVGVGGEFWVNSVIGSNEPSTLELEVRNSVGTLLATHVLSTAIMFDAALKSNRYVVNNLSFSIPNNSFLLMKLTAAPWVTNPTVCWGAGSLSIRH